MKLAELSLFLLYMLAIIKITNAQYCSASVSFTFWVFCLVLFCSTPNINMTFKFVLGSGTDCYGSIGRNVRVITAKQNMDVLENVWEEVLHYHTSASRVNQNIESINMQIPQLFQFDNPNNFMCFFLTVLQLLWKYPQYKLHTQQFKQFMRVLPAMNIWLDPTTTSPWRQKHD